MITRRLIINADDFGLTEGVNQAVVELARFGTLTDTSVLVNCAMHDQQSISPAKISNIGLGIHLNLTCGQPILPPEDLDTLVDGEGYFHKAEDFFRSLNQINLIQVEKEWRAQVVGFSIKFGRPDHLDSHHHIHLLPRLFPLFLQLASELQVPVRLPITWDLPSEVTRFGDFSGLGKHIDPEMVEHDSRLIQGTGIRFPDYFTENFLPFLENDPKLLKEVFHNLPFGVTELMCHPAYVDQSLQVVSSYVDEREAERKSLMNSTLKDIFRAEEIELIRFQNV